MRACGFWPCRTRLPPLVNQSIRDNNPTKPAMDSALSQKLRALSLLGIAMGFLTGEGTKWRRDPALRRVYAAASWIWVVLFFSRLIVQTPLYLAGWVEVQGIVKIVMGYPLFLGNREKRIHSRCVNELSLQSFDIYIRS